MLTDYESLLKEYDGVIQDYQINRFTFLVTGASGFVGRNMIEILNSLKQKRFGKVSIF
jgi:hypothetical protein